MADGVGVTEGAGKVVATDEKNFGAGVVHVQLIGVVDARDGQTGQVGVESNALRIADIGLVGPWKTTPVDLTQNVAAVAVPSTPLANRKSVVIFNESDVPIWVGSAATVTNTGVNRGIRIPSGQTFEADLGPTAIVYAYVPTSGAAGTKAITVAELS